MTQKRNHYNVKFLRGYGVSVNLKESKLVLKNGYDYFAKEQEKEEWFITNLPYEKIVLSGKGYVSTEAISLLNQNNRNLILLDTFGNPVSFVNGMMSSLTATKYRITQYDMFRDESKRKYLVQQVMHSKRKSQIEFLKKVGVTIKDFNSNEAQNSRKYFRYYSELIPAKFGFDSRNNSSLRVTKRNASDVINGLLNYGYSVLAAEISKYICGLGLDPYYGFMHKTHTGFMSLVYDLIEPFRWLVDYSVYKMANSKSSRHRIKKKEYAFTKNGSVVLDDSLIRRFLELLERTFHGERLYKFRHGIKRKDGLSMCQEITIVKITVQDLADYCRGHSQSFLEGNR